VRDHVGDRLDLAFEDMGEQNLKNIERPNSRLQRGAEQARRSRYEGRSAGTTGTIGTTIDCRASIQQYERRPGTGVFHDGITEDIITDCRRSPAFRLSPVNGVYLQR